MGIIKKRPLASLMAFAAVIFANVPVWASEADLKIPEFTGDHRKFLLIGIGICILGMVYGLIEFVRVKNLKAHKSMTEMGEIIFDTCRTYLLQQGKLLIILEVFIAICIGFYFGFLQKMPVTEVGIILGWSILGILGSYGVAWYGIRMNTYANARTAYASLYKKPLRILEIPLQAGISIGLLLVSVELIMMLIILLFVPGHLAGACFIGFAIGESLGASALRVAGGIFTKIADIGSDLMKIAFKIKEDDPRNPGVIADCTGDNAGDSVGPTADGFETYGVTGVALISFIVLAVADPSIQVILLTWIFVMRILMIVTSLVSYWINGAITKLRFANKDMFDFEKPLTDLVWLTSILSIIMTFGVSYWQLAPLGAVNAAYANYWLVLSVIISCGTLGAALIPEGVKVFTSPNAKHTKEVVTASREGGAPLTILSGLVAGNFAAFWLGLVMVLLMFGAYIASGYGLSAIMIYPSIFAFGLVAFGFLGMGPVTIAVDSYGPVTDNAQSIYELSQIETNSAAQKELKAEFGYAVDFERAKHFLEANDGAGNTFKATAKPVLIGTAVVGATTMIFSLILVIQKTLGVQPEQILNILNPYTILGFMCGGAVIYWFTGASMQAVTTGSYRAVEFIKKNIKLDTATQAASNENSKAVVKICTQYAQAGMFNIFIAVFSFALAFAFFAAPVGLTADMSPEDKLKYAAPISFFVSYLIGIAVIGLYQAIFMANAGGCWDNAKKIVEVDLKEKNTPLHDATIVGDTVGDPFKDTSSVALNPIIKFTTLFGLLAMEIAISASFRDIAHYVGAVFFIIALIFVWRSFYKMRIPVVDLKK